MDFIIYLLLIFFVVEIAAIGMIVYLAFGLIAAIITVVVFVFCSILAFATCNINKGV